ncbi:YqiA/YcfP family alpha/beta fold hydrolase [Methylibium sp.]|uniref:YqiA/YcfP family alpha/beta fold hydrolase n=1 Tax=Methylibium sp. TaxID=2067992 RepID=UPI0018372838|nr:YqiA/YcfP family alpha/beta fold hydrolase [Methylibium sp.]MBA3591674.1 esterase [Methylibium sp.]
MAATTHLLYLHGFRSSPASAKAVRMAAEAVRLQRSGRSLAWCCPQLPPSPAGAMALIEKSTRDWPADTLAVIGSSLGGFYATVLAEQRGCSAVLLNPAVDPATSLAGQIGEQTGWQDTHLRFEFTAAHVEELRAMTPAQITRPERYFTVIAKGDEVLEWRQMRARYLASPGRLLEGGDHALSDFEPHLPDILQFLGLS